MGVNDDIARHGSALPEREKAWRKARRILAVRLDNMGDVLMTTPALRALRASSPERRITLLTSRSGAAAAAFVPEVDEVLLAAPLPWLPGAKTAPGAHAELIDQLRRGSFDAAVVFTVYSQSALPAAMLCWQAGIPLILAHCRENPYGLLSDWVAEPEPHIMLRHEVQRQLDLVASVGAWTEDVRLSFRVPALDTMRMLKKLAAAGADSQRRWIVVHPGATAASRRYPARHYASLIRNMAISGDYQIVLSGDGSEQELIAEIRTLAADDGDRLISLPGRLTLGELGALIRAAAVLIANNTGPVHIAAAVGTPVVDIYALTNPQHAPWQVPNRVLYHDVPCRFCYRSVCPQTHHDCLRLLEPERVAEAAYELLQLGMPRSSPRAEHPAKAG